MVTAVEVETTVEATSNAKCAAIISKIDKNQKENLALYTSLGLTARAEAYRLKYDEKQARKMLVLSWRVACELKETDERLIALFDSEQAPNVSKAMRLAFPVDQIATQELETILAHNAKSAKKVGVNRMLLVARGKLKAKDAINGVKVERAPRSTGQADSNVPPLDQFGNSLSALIKTAIAKKVEIADLRKLANSMLDEFAKQAKS